MEYTLEVPIDRTQEIMTTELQFFKTTLDLETSELWDSWIQRDGRSTAEFLRSAMVDAMAKTPDPDPVKKVRKLPEADVRSKPISVRIPRDLFNRYQSLCNVKRVKCSDQLYKQVKAMIAAKTAPMVSPLDFPRGGGSVTISIRLTEHDYDLMVRLAKTHGDPISGCLQMLIKNAVTPGTLSYA